MCTTWEVTSVVRPELHLFAAVATVSIASWAHYLVLYFFIKTAFSKQAKGHLQNCTDEPCHF